jgi:hypothetical protein
LAFFSASSKSIVSAVIFFAPSFAFFAPSTLVFLGPVAVVGFFMADDATALCATGAVDEASVPGAGDLERPFAPPAVRNGDAVRDITGVCVFEGGLLGLLIAGLSHDEKKSSPPSPWGVEEPPGNVGERMSVITTSFGNLRLLSAPVRNSSRSQAYSRTSMAALRFNSSLYLTAVFDVYRFFMSLLANAADPPCD